MARLTLLLTGKNIPARKAMQAASSMLRLLQEVEKSKYQVKKATIPWVVDILSTEENVTVVLRAEAAGKNKDAESVIATTAEVMAAAQTKGTA